MSRLGELDIASSASQSGRLEGACMSGNECATRAQVEDEPDPSAGGSRLKRVGLLAVNGWGSNFTVDLVVAVGV